MYLYLPRTRIVISVDKVSHFKSLTRLRDFSMKSHETYETFETFETWKFQHKYNVNSTQNTIYFLNSKVYWFFFHFYLSYTYKFQKYFFHINPKGHILKNIPQFWPPQPFLLHFYASIFFKCHNYCVFRTISLPKT